MLQNKPRFLFSRDQIITFQGRVPHQAITEFCEHRLQSSRHRKNAEASQGLVIVEEQEDLELISRVRSTRAGTTGPSRSSLQILSDTTRIQDELAGLSQKPDAIAGNPRKIIDHLRRGNIDPCALGMIIIVSTGLQDGSRFWQDIDFILTKAGAHAIKHVFVPDISQDLYQIMSHLHRPGTYRLQQWLNEHQESSMARHRSAIDEEQLADRLELIVQEIHESEDPAELDEYRRIFKKNVSIFKRAYVAAYMLKYFQDGGRKPTRKRRDQQKETAKPRRERNERSAAPDREESASQDGNPDMVSVFIGIGRTRRVFPRDIVGLILDKTGLSREDVGSIKILDNYSFADIHKDKTDELIQALNGIEYRGRTLNVNYAKKK